MTATTVPLAAAVAAVKLVATHQCVVCRDLPERPFDKADVDPGQDYRPRKPAAITSGKTARSFRCLRHTRAKKRADSLVLRTGVKARRFGVPRAVQVALWDYQGRACPCGRKRAEQIPAGITLHHDRVLARLHDHPDEEGCPGCVVAFLCVSCNRDVVGRLERTYAADYARIAAALVAVATTLTDPPLQRLLAERPELLKENAA